MIRRAAALPALLTASLLVLTACSPAAEDETDAAASSASECREVEDANGTVCIPAEPQRIVVLDPLMALPTLLSVDAPVVGAATVYADGVSFPDYIDEDDLSGIETVGAMQDPSMEAIAALEPDLIISDSSSGSSAFTEELEKIAPVVAAPYSFYRNDWIDDVRFIADVVGRSDLIEDEIADYEDHAAEVAAALAESGDVHTLSRVDVYDGTPLYYRSGCTWFGAVLADAGVSQPAAQGPDECAQGDAQSVIVYLSAEQLNILDADAIVSYQQQSTSSEIGASPLDALTGNELWDALPAVQNDALFVFGDAWGLGVSLEAANEILDDLETIFPAS